MNYTQSFENRQADTGLVCDVAHAVAALTLTDLRHHVRWCAWHTVKRTRRDGTEKLVKMPVGRSQGAFKANDPETWMGWAEACKIRDILPKLPGHQTGIGIVLGALRGVAAGYTLTGVDLDSCLDGRGVMADWAVDVLEALGPIYAEVSPSGYGVKAFMLVRSEDDLAGLRTMLDIGKWKRSWKFVSAVAAVGDHAAGAEVHTGNTFYTVTGDGSAPLGVLGLDAVKVLGERLTRWFGDGVGGRRAVGAGGDVDVTDEMIRAVGDMLPDGLEDLTDEDRRIIEALPAVKALWEQTFVLGGRDKTLSTAAWRMAGELRRAGIEARTGVRLLLKCPWNWERYAAMDEWEGRRQIARDWYRHDVKDNGMNVGLPRRSAGAAAVEVVAETESQISVTNKLIIELHAGINEVVDTAEQVLETCGAEVFQHGGKLVRPYALEMDSFGGKKTLAPGFDVLSVHSAIDMLATTANWSRWDARAKSPVRTTPSELIANIWLSRKGQWLARRVKGVVTAPTIRPDGSLVTEAGWDKATRLFMVIDPALSMPEDGRWRGERLVKADAEAALQMLEGLLEDFPFVGAADRSVALSGLLIPVVRGALDKRPLHVFDAPNPGTGKTYLVEICTALSLGQSAPVSSWSLDDGENEKRLSSLLLSGTPVGVLDNINGVLSSDLLCQALDQATLRIRVFGKLEHRDIENNICLYATGNNIVVSGDLVRRALVAKLDAEMERPEIRSFHGDPLRRVQEDRGTYLAAALTVVRAHMQAGYPGCEGMQPMASFSEWGRLVRGALRWLGRTDPVDTSERTFREDPKRSDLRDFIEAWVRRYGYEERSTREAIDMLNHVGGDNRPLPDTRFSRSSDALTAQEIVSMFRDAALRIAGRNDVVDTKLLGNWLKRNKGMVVNRHRFVLGNAEGKNKIQRWRVELVLAPLMRVDG